MEIKIVAIENEDDIKNEDVIKIVDWDNTKSCNLIVLKVGNKDYPATKEDILDVAKNVGEALQQFKDTGNPPIMVTSHTISTEFIPVHTIDYERAQILMKLYDKNVITEKVLKSELNLD